VSLLPGSFFRAEPQRLHREIVDPNVADDFFRSLLEIKTQELGVRSENYTFSNGDVYSKLMPACNSNPSHLTID
jgi:hypothetical protein